MFFLCKWILVRRCIVLNYVCVYRYESQLKTKNNRLLYHKPREVGLPIRYASTQVAVISDSQRTLGINMLTKHFPGNKISVKTYFSRCSCFLKSVF